MCWSSAVDLRLTFGWGPFATCHSPSLTLFPVTLFSCTVNKKTQKGQKNTKISKCSYYLIIMRTFWSMAIIFPEYPITITFNKQNKLKDLHTCSFFPPAVTKEGINTLWLKINKPFTRNYTQVNWPTVTWPEIKLSLSTQIGWSL